MSSRGTHYTLKACQLALRASRLYVLDVAACRYVSSAVAHGTSTQTRRTAHGNSSLSKQTAAAHTDGLQHVKIAMAHQEHLIAKKTGPAAVYAAGHTTSSARACSSSLDVPADCSWHKRTHAMANKPPPHLRIPLITSSQRTPFPQNSMPVQILQLQSPPKSLTTVRIPAACALLRVVGDVRARLALLRVVSARLLRCGLRRLTRLLLRVGVTGLLQIGGQQAKAGV